MVNNESLLRELHVGRARFYLCDLHVHSPASADVANGDRLENLSPIERFYIEKVKPSNAKYPDTYEKLMVDAFKINDYYELLIKHKNKVVEEQGIFSHDDWAILALTDHNICKYACEVSSYAFKKEELTKNRLVILPGMELDVSFPIDGADNIINAHMILIYTPATKDHDIISCIKEASGNWDYGYPIEIRSLPEFTKKIRENKSHPGIVVAAHINSSSGVRQEAKELMLSRLEAAIVRSNGELENAKLDQEKEEIRVRIEELIKERSSNDLINLKILKLIGICGFDALQVQTQKEEPHFRFLHRFDKNKGRAVPIVCSDSHRIEDIYYCRGNGSAKVTPYLKLSSISADRSSTDLFNEIRDKSIRLGETRFTSTGHEKVRTWINGIEIVPDSENAKHFWPFHDNLNEDCRFVMPFSKNLNCLVGGRGSGKSALIDAIAFIFDKKSDFSAANKKEDFYKRSVATLQGCRLRVCWQSTHDNNTGAFFISRFFSPTDSHEQVKITDKAGNELMHSDYPTFEIDLYRIHKIEDLAKETSSLRNLFDSICGNEIENVQSEINDRIEGLLKNRNELIQTAKDINTLLKEGSPLREYDKRNAMFENVDNAEIQSMFAFSDQIAGALNTANSIKDKWNKTLQSLRIDEQKIEFAEVFKYIRDRVYDKEKKCKPFLEGFEAIIKDGEKEKSFETNILANLDKLNEVIERVGILLDSSIKEILVKQKKAVEELNKSGFPKGGDERQDRKNRLDEAIQALEQYKRFMSNWQKLNGERDSLFNELECYCKQRTELRKKTALAITESLRKDLDKDILVIEADARAMSDKSRFREWLQKNWHVRHNIDERVDSLLDKGLLPSTLKSLIIENSEDVSILLVEKEKAAEGRIEIEDAKKFVDTLKPTISYKLETSYSTEFLSHLPKEIQDGLVGINETKLEEVLKLDEIVIDDEPVIQLNDRPGTIQTLKPLNELSPGQRCSAILPILLLNGSNPLIIDQPEDNLDNRLIRQVVVNILASIKLKRQVILATHNPNLPVLGDSEQVIGLQAIEDSRCNVEAKGNLDSEKVVNYITQVMEGGREAFQYRLQIYQSYWEGGATPD